MKDDSTNVLNDEVQESMSLPENAFTELKPGEEYVPPMRPDKTYPEATGYSVSMGLNGSYFQCRRSLPWVESGTSV